MRSCPICENQNTFIFKVGSFDYVGCLADCPSRKFWMDMKLTPDEWSDPNRDGVKICRKLIVLQRSYMRELVTNINALVIGDIA